MNIKEVSNGKIYMGMWEMLNRGEMTAEELSVKRFEVFFEKYHIN